MTEDLDRFRPKWLLPPPGDTILDILEERNWNHSEFADRAGYATEYVSRLVRGQEGVTEDIALRLERVLGGSAEFWLSREAKYREAVACGGKQASGERDRMA